MTEFNSGSTPHAPQSTDPQLVAGLAADLAALDYTVDGVEQLLGSAAYEAFSRDQLVPAKMATEEELAAAAPNPLAAVVRLWLLGEAVDKEQLAAALPATGVAGLETLGLAADDGGRHRASVDLRPYAFGQTEIWVASDLGAHQQAGVLRRDHVLGIGQASLTLAQLTIRTEVDRALDLGTGCGIQLFHLLGHARHVTATDISERALAFTRFNLLLNAPALGLDPDNLAARVSLRLGSLLDPVAGEQFDLAVSNPPFVITPRTSETAGEELFTYRDGGLPGDDIVATLVRRLPSVLVPGGTAQMLGNWEIPAAAPSWHDRIESWLDPQTEAWVIQREQLSPSGYAETWLRDASENRDPKLYERFYRAYLEDFAARNVEAVGFGMLWLRRAGSGQGERDGGSRVGQPSGRLLRRFEELTYPLQQPIGPHLAAAVQRHDWLAAHEGDFPGQRLVAAEDVTEERHQRPGAEHPGVILLRQGAGLRRTNLMSSELAGFVSASDGELTVGQLVTALAALLEQPEEEFAARLQAEVRHLVADGFLVPAGD
ncbi:methyltransferase small [Arthrobacter crystallopoietes BAB-32]|uniref:Methyltransferase small n=1 Tax=Arthrobacter crystallopoietes BAB-32 TaxID=1246476 RepID=N1V8E5_9MICC|nr:methyltransferase small [Arthrobacter crystallopoietes BAB-32]